MLRTRATTGHSATRPAGGAFRRGGPALALAVAVLLADLDAGVESSMLARRLRGPGAGLAAGQAPAGTS